MIHYEFVLGVYETVYNAKYAIQSWWKNHPDAKNVMSNVTDFLGHYRVTLAYDEEIRCPQEE